MKITPTCTIAEEEIVFEFMRSSGPGGQNVNKVESAVRLRFDLENSRSLPDSVKSRLRNIAGKRVTKAGVLTIVARRSRRQEKNRQEALARLKKLIEQALQKPKPFKKTSIPVRSKLERLNEKKHRSRQKQLRRSSGSLDE